jgi:hypothetical protein
MASTTAIKVRAPSRAGMSARRLGAMAAAGGRRFSSAAAKAAASEKHTLTALGAAAALGYVEKNRIQVPHIQAIGVDGTVGLGLWALGKYTKNPVLQHMATGALACAVKGAVVNNLLSPAGTGAPNPAAAAQQQMQPQQPQAPQQAPGVMGGAF